ncbi:3-hydroxyacyl-dehydrogenase [Ceraceosorus bombacis]|uniref:3-hydroxyacyl-CoA dehydrogenase n=1 Tax=Ceraceosorus bombacis TaxID=401625 RepID=A0A0P1BL67_9BASI|nr:3-hydroxyacyl-dehydrogenase [Ceraceosorus bombacis]
MISSVATPLRTSVLRSAATRAPAGFSARNFSTSLAASKEVQNVTVFGAGLMGAGIAQVLAHKGGYNVTLADVSEKATAGGQSIISKSLTRIFKKSMADKSAEEQAEAVKKVVDSIKVSTDGAGAVKETDLVIEAIIENVGIKQELFKFLDGKAPKDAIFASNTSSLSIKDVAATISEERKALFGGFHAFNPVPQMKLIEIVKTDQTSKDAFESLTAVAKKMGKVPVSCVDSPGFIVNRLLVPYMLEAIRLVERGEATKEDRMERF